MFSLVGRFDLKWLRRRFGIAAPKLVVRSYVSWQWRVGVPLVALSLFGVGAWSLTRQTKAGELGAVLNSLKQQIAIQQSELSRLRTEATASESALSIERVAQQKLLLRTHELEAEIVSLREDIRVCERLAPLKSNVSRKGPKISR